MYDECVALITGCGLVDREGKSCADIVAAQFHAHTEFDGFGRVERIVHLAEGVAPDGILAQYGCRSHQYYGAEGIGTQFAGQHRRYYAALRVSNDGDTLYIIQAAYIFIYFPGVGNLVRNGHLFEGAFAISVSVKIKTDGGNAVCLKRVGNHLKSGPSLRPPNP